MPTDPADDALDAPAAWSWLTETHRGFGLESRGLTFFATSGESVEIEGLSDDAVDIGREDFLRDFGAADFVPLDTSKIA